MDEKTRLGRYRLLKPLGSGGMAEVFLADICGPQGFHKVVVLKRMRAALAQDPRFCVMFAEEARLAARLNHPNVVQTYEVGEETGSYFIVMEYLDGQALSHLAQRAREEDASVRPEVWMRVVSDALQGLSYLHRLSDYCGRPLEVVHRDVSPQNVFVTYEGNTKILDFGVAKVGWRRAHDTQGGVLKGKLAYMAPEQARGEPVDARADVFAMGVVLWELIAGRRLFAAGDNAKTLERLLFLPIPSLTDVVPGLDPRIAATVSRAVARERDQRFASAADMFGAIEENLATLPRRAGRAEVAETMTAFFEGERELRRRELHDLLRGDDGQSVGAPSSAVVETVAARLRRRRALSTGSFHVFGLRRWPSGK
jgi:serine/threonine-protein kinase